jgi:tRNA nucleotidyltransferase/poly(A) polymerase
MLLEARLAAYMEEASTETRFMSKHNKVKHILANSEQAREDLKPHSRARKRTARHLERHAEHMAHAIKKHAHPDDHKCAVKCAHKVLKGEIPEPEEVKGALRAYKHVAGKSKHVGNAILELGRHSVESSEVTADAGTALALGAAGLTAGAIAGGAYIQHKINDYGRRKQAQYNAEEMHKKQAAATPPKPPHKTTSSVDGNTDIGNLSDHEALKAFHEGLAKDVLDMPISSKLLAKHADFI